MKIRILFAAGWLLLASAGRAQQVSPPASKMKFDIGPQFSLPLNPIFNTTHSIGLGASSRSAYYFTNEISTGIRINYDYFLSKKYPGTGNEGDYYNLTWTSFLANFQYDFKKNVFVGGDIGIGMLGMRGTVNSMFNSSLYIGKAIKFSRSTLGIAFHWTQARESGNRDETMGLRAAYRFN